MRLLLVEDDRLLADELQSVLEASGYAVDRAEDGESTPVIAPPSVQPVQGQSASSSAPSLLPEVLEAHRRDQRKSVLRFWSAACASGAEAYSIAICLADNMYRLRDWSLKVLGTDISEEALQAARQGIFKPRALESVGDKQRRRYFRHQKESDLWEVRPEIKKLVDFIAR